MIPSEIATAADYAQALMTVRRAKNVLALVIGIVVGTFSSIFIASPILLVWTQWNDARVALPAGGVR